MRERPAVFPCAGFEPNTIAWSGVELVVPDAPATAANELETFGPKDELALPEAGSARATMRVIRRSGCRNILLVRRSEQKLIDRVLPQEQEKDKPRTGEPLNPRRSVP